MADVNVEHAFPYEKTLLNTIIKNAKETKVKKKKVYNLNLTYIVLNI